MNNKKLRVAVLMGGDSSEAPVSFKSGKNIAKALKEVGCEVFEFDFWPDEIPNLISCAPDMVFNMMHGKFGEDGCVQGLLEMLSLPYSGSDVLASSLAMNKHVTKQILNCNNISAPKGFLIEKDAEIELEAVTEKIEDLLSGYPCVVKPNCSGSTVGLTILKNKSGLDEALKKAKTEKDDILIEEFISGKEITASILGDRALPVIEISTTREIFDWEAKYTPGFTEHIIPARLPKDTLQKCQEIAVESHKSLGCKGASRVDMIVTETNDIFVLEINTIPGMTDTSLYPDALKSTGMDLRDFVTFMIRDCLG